MDNLYQIAHDVAKKVHGAQKRKYDGAPYISHLEAVSRILALQGYDEPVIQAAALLHDTVEDTDVTIQDLVETLGANVAELVYGLTDAEKGNRKTRVLQSTWRLSHAPLDAKLIKCADIIDNSRTILDVDRHFAPKFLVEKRLILERMATVESDLTDLPLYEEALYVTGYPPLLNKKQASALAGRVTAA